MNKKQMSLKLSAVALAVLLASCGGGGSEGYYNQGGSSSNNGSSTVTGATATALRYSLDKDSLIIGGNLNIDLVAIDQSGNVIADKVTNVKVKNLSSTTATISKLGTNDSGWTSYKLTIAASKDAFDRMPHDVILELTADGVTQEVTVPVAGGVVDIDSQMTSVKNGGTASIKVRAVDALQQPLIGKVELRNKNNDVISTVTSTDAKGEGVATINYNDVLKYGSDHHLDLYAVFVTAKASETRTLSSSALGFTAAVEDTSVLAFTHNPSDIKSGQTKDVEVTVYAAAQAELAGKSVVFETSLGAITSSAPVANIQQNANGQWQGTAKAVLSTNTGTGNVIGNATIAATFNGSTITTQQSINALAIANLSMQALATTVGVNTTTKLYVTAKDSQGYLVKGAKVSFKIITDPSLGILSRVSAVTNDQGIATIDYTAGPSATQSNAVALQATSGSIISNILNLTVANQSAYISIAESASLDTSELTYYTKSYSVNVVDSLQRPLKGQIISLAIKPVAYNKGTLRWNKVDEKWEIDYKTRYACSEFSTGAILLTNNVTQSGQQSITGTTDESGNLNFKVRYGKNYAWWSEAHVIASATVSTRIYNQSVEFDAPMALEDVKNEGTPANKNSPFNTFTCPN